MLLHNVKLKLKLLLPLLNVERLAAHSDGYLLIFRHHLRLQRLHIREAHLRKCGLKIRTAHLLPHVAQIRVHAALPRRPLFRRHLRSNLRNDRHRLKLTLGRATLREPALACAQQLATEFCLEPLPLTIQVVPLLLQILALALGVT